MPLTLPHVRVASRARGIAWLAWSTSSRSAAVTDLFTLSSRVSWPERPSSARASPTCRLSVPFLGPPGQDTVPDRPQPVHGLVLAPAEVVVQPHVFRVEPVVHIGAGRIWLVYVGVDPAHGVGRGRHVRVGARGDRRVDGRTQGPPLPGTDHAERAPGRADDPPGQPAVHQYRTFAPLPVQRDQPMGSGRQRASLLVQQLLQRY